MFTGRRDDYNRTVEFVKRGFATEVYQGRYQVRRVERKETVVLGEYYIGYTRVRSHKGVREVHQRKEDNKAVRPDCYRRVPRRIRFHKRVEATDQTVDRDNREGSIGYLFNSHVTAEERAVILRDHGFG